MAGEEMGAGQLGFTYLKPEADAAYNNLESDANLNLRIGISNLFISIGSISSMSERGEPSAAA